MCIGNTTSPASSSTINWYPREEERVTTLSEGPQIGDTPRATGGKNRSKVSGGAKGGKQSERY